jgi:hypothetical protein
LGPVSVYRSVLACGLALQSHEVGAEGWPQLMVEVTPHIRYKQGT